MPKPFNAIDGACRMISGFGDGSTLTVVDSPYGRIGSIICWENMPMLRILTADLGLGDIGARRDVPGQWICVRRVGPGPRRGGSGKPA